MHIDSERFVHDELLRRAESGLPGILESWRMKRSVDPFFISWPSEHIRCDDGSVVTDYFLLELPEERGLWGKLMVQAVEMTKSYAILLTEQREEDVLVIFETVQGTRSWRYPIKPHGNVRILGDPTVRDDVDSIGLLWTPESHEA